MPRITGTDKTGISIGTVIPVAQAAGLPAGAILCDGLAVSRSVYSKLFGIIGTTWGAGDGSTTFNLPDLRGRTLIGSGTGSGLSARSVASAVGVENQGLSTANLPSHTHSGSGNTGNDSPGHTHTVAIAGADDFNAPRNTVGLVVADNMPFGPYTFTSAGANTNHQHGYSFTTDGGSGLSGTSHNNMQPSSVVQWAIVYI